jgi:type II secretory pathway pseudopilin PulG
MNTECRMQNAECRMQDPISRNADHAPLRTPHSALRASPAFTMIEIALSLAIIGFALVAIISVLPLGMSVQRENREETIINQDASVFMNAIRNGARGLDDLTNYVMAITNYYTTYVNGQPAATPAPGYHWFTNDNSSYGLVYRLASGSNIVGVLSTPKYIYADPTALRNGDFLSNHVVAYVRALSGPASDKFPQTNAALQELGLSYRMIAEVVPYGTNYYDPSWVSGAGGANYWMAAKNSQANLHDVRLTFRWPLVKDTKALGRQVFRTLASGPLLGTNDQFSGPLFFFKPQSYVKARE